MNLSVFGATGRTGSHVVRKALTQGHRVTALVRDPAGLVETHEKLTVITGDVFEAVDVEKTVRGADAVVCALGQSKKAPRNTMTRGTEMIVAAMKRLEVRRVVAVSTMGAGDSAKHIGFVMRALLRTILRKQVLDHEHQEAVLRESGLDWTVVRPGSLQMDPGTGRYQVGFDLGVGRIPREDVADFILAELIANAYLQKAPSIIA